MCRSTLVPHGDNTRAGEHLGGSLALFLHETRQSQYTLESSNERKHASDTSVSARILNIGSYRDIRSERTRLPVTLPSPITHT
jgi:hypothetical protein